MTQRERRTEYEIRAQDKRYRAELAASRIAEQMGVPEEAIGVDRLGRVTLETDLAEKVARCLVKE